MLLHDIPHSRGGVRRCSWLGATAIPSSQPSEKVSPLSHVLLHWVPAAAKAENFSLYKMQRLCIFLPGEVEVMGSKNFLLESAALLTDF